MRKLSENMAMLALCSGFNKHCVINQMTKTTIAEQPVCKALFDQVPANAITMRWHRVAIWVTAPELGKGETDLHRQTDDKP